MLTLLRHRTRIHMDKHQIERTPKKLHERKNGDDYVTPSPRIGELGSIADSPCRWVGESAILRVSKSELDYSTVLIPNAWHEETL